MENKRYSFQVSHVTIVGDGNWGSRVKYLLTEPERIKSDKKPEDEEDDLEDLSEEEKEKLIKSLPEDLRKELEDFFKELREVEKDKSGPRRFKERIFDKAGKDFKINQKGSKKRTFKKLGRGIPKGYSRKD